MLQLECYKGTALYTLYLQEEFGVSVTVLPMAIGATLTQIIVMMIGQMMMNVCLKMKNPTW